MLKVLTNNNRNNKFFKSKTVFKKLIVRIVINYLVSIYWKSHIKKSVYVKF